MLRYGFRAGSLGVLLMLSGCAGEQHFVRDSFWPFGNPNAPDIHGETAERALGHMPEVTPLVPQAGNVWPGPVQPMPTLADVEKDVNKPLGQGNTPSVPSPYPPGPQAPEQTESGGAGNTTVPLGNPPQAVPGNPHMRE